MSCGRNHTLTDTPGGSKLTIEMDSTPEYASYFNETWPKALRQAQAHLRGPARTVSLVLGWLGDLVDHQHLDRRLPRLDLEPELHPDRRHQVRPILDVLRQLRRRIRP